MKGVLGLELKNAEVASNGVKGRSGEELKERPSWFNDMVKVGSKMHDQKIQVSIPCILHTSNLLCKIISFHFFVTVIFFNICQLI
jgi:hypothetical protein